MEFADPNQAVRGAQALADEAAVAAEGAEMGAELGAMGGPLGMVAGAGLGANAVGLANMALRSREAEERQDHFLDARSLNNQNASVRPIRPRFDRNTELLRPRMESYGGEEVPSYHPMDTPSPPPWRPDDEAPGRRQDVMRPTAAARPQMPRMTAQRAVDESAAQQPAPEVLRLQRRVARNRLPPSNAPASSSQGGSRWKLPGRAAGHCGTHSGQLFFCCHALWSERCRSPALACIQPTAPAIEAESSPRGVTRKDPRTR